MSGRFFKSIISIQAMRSWSDITGGFDCLLMAFFQAGRFFHQMAFGAIFRRLISFSSSNG
jgi:hypothetical protein